MRQLAIAFSIFIGVLLICWITLRLTGWLQYYRTPSPANYPTFKPGDHFFSSNRVEPKMLDFICFSTKGLTDKNEISLFRLCGMRATLLN